MALPEKTLAEIRETIKAKEVEIPELEKDIEDAKRAGIDVSKQIEELNKAKEALRKLKAVYE